MRSKGYEIGHGAGREAIFEQASMLFERDMMVHHANQTLQTLDAEYEGLVFGRLDHLDSERVYVGRLGIRDAEFDNLVTDWRAPAAAAFYQATAEEPMDVVRRRVIRCSGQTVLDVDDDVLIADAVPEDMRIVGEGALMAALGRSRGEKMRDIVATIQREQDEVIRAPWRGVTEITGGPGTGKTAVALHRAAYLLYRHRRQLGGAGVLVVGPSGVFTNYISRVLPSMGETNVELRALGGILDGLEATRQDAAPKGVLNRNEISMLAADLRDRSRGWSVADIALLDELRVLLGQPPKRKRRQVLEAEPERGGGAPQRPEHYDEYSHVVVDESQDLSPMQWRMVGRRGKYASWTVVGDPVQSSWPDPAEAAMARDQAFGVKTA